MKFSAATLASVVAASSFVSALPLLRRAGTGTTKQMAQSISLDTSGAVFFLTNEPDVNQIIAATINVDGTLNLDRAVAAGGRGSHGQSTGPDAMFSQGSIKASQKGKVLAAVNAGSNTVALFTIDPTQPTNLQPLGDVVSSEGEFPMSVAFNSAGSRFCVLNGGQVNGVNCYNIDKNLGPVAIPNSLRSLNIKQTTPPTGPAGTASQVIFSEDDSQLIASVKGSGADQPGFFAIWDVANDGSLSANFKKVAPGKGGSLPFSMTVIPGKDALLVTDPGIGFEILNLKDTSKNTASNITGQVATCWSAFSPSTKDFYVTDIGGSSVTEISIDGNLKGTVIAELPQTPGSATIDLDIASINGKDFIYVLAANATSIDVISIDSPGIAARLTALDISGPTTAAGIPIRYDHICTLNAIYATAA